MKKNFHLGFYSWALALMVWFTTGGPMFSMSSGVPSTPTDPFQHAWQLAGESGQYDYRSHMDQTVYPAPSVANAGRAPDVSHLGLQGSVNLPAKKMEFTLWQDASFNPNTGVSMRVEDGQAYARRGLEGWKTMDNPADTFAPGGDPLGFLVGAQNIQAVGPDELTLDGLQLKYTKYTFDLNGPAIAEHIKAQIEELHRKKYNLPPGFELSAPEAYRRMTGTGQLWVNENGLPARMTVNLEIPDQPQKGQRLQTSISNEYFNYNLAALHPAAPSLWQNPADWAKTTLITAQGALGQNAGQIQTILVVLLLSILGLRYGHTLLFRRALIITIITSMVFTPFLQSVQASSYYDRVTADHAAQEKRQADAKNQQDIAAQYKQSKSWNPNLDPKQSAAIAKSAETVKAATGAAPVAQPPNKSLAIVNQRTLPVTRTASTSTTQDSDSDGLSDEDESYWGTCAYSAGSTSYLASADCANATNPMDSDGDGLADYTEVYQLNTSPVSTDTDGDSISDALEIQGFTYAGQTWYLNPIEEDTNSDGLVDSGECNVATSTTITSLSSTICPDTDNDGTPDFVDDDNDGDGVPDQDDLSPNIRGTQIYSDNNPLNLSISDLTVGEPVFVDIQLTPTNADHLTYYNHVLDWPYDDSGQIQRRLNTTWANTANTTYQSSDANAANGDIRLVPMLEITIPYTDGHYANLPVKSGYSATRALGDPVDNWLDTGVTDPYSMQISDSDLSTGKLVAYTPLVLNSDDSGTPKAFSTRVIYQPSQASWGAAQQYRVVWLMHMLTDECIDSTADEDTCARQDTVTILHYYDESWELTGLNVSEEHGLDVALMYEDPAKDTNLTYDDQLWTASWNLGNTFLRGRDCDTYDQVNKTCNGNGERDVTINNLSGQVSAWNLDYTQVDTFTYLHQGYMSQIMMTETVGILDKYFKSYTTQTVPTILIAQETTTRANNLDNYTGSLNTDLNIPMSTSVAPFQTVAGLSWASYQYQDGNWQNYDSQEYIEYLGDSLATQDYFKANDSSQSEQDDSEGKILWAQMYYAALYNGAQAMVELNDSLIWEPSVSFSEDELSPISYTNSNWGASTIAYEFLMTYASNKFSPQLQSGLWKTITSYANSVTDGTPMFIRINKGGFGGNMVAIAAIAVIVVAVPLLLLGYMTGNTLATRIGVIMMSLVTIVVSTFYIVMAVQRIMTVIETVAGFAATVSKALTAGRAFQGMGVIGLVLGTTMTWGMVGYMLITGKVKGVSASYAIAMAIASTIVLMIYFVLDVIGLGILVLILVFCDAVMAIFNMKGPTQLLTEAISSTLYDVRMLITNLDDSTRLKLALDNVSLSDPDGGFTVSNSLVFTVSATNTLKYRTYSYDGTTIDFNDLDSRAVFRYYAQAAEVDRHNQLTEGEMSGEWVKVSSDQAKTSATASLAVPLSDLGTGIAQSLDGNFYLTEAYITPYQGCWKVAGAVVNCNWYKFSGSSHINLGEEMVYDVLPSTLDEFEAMNWDSALPIQTDTDNDQLTTTAGTDPDDSAMDTDGDGLSDYYEITYGLNPSSADGDGDGLNDAQELKYGTNPYAADSDGDGLNDYIEAVTGWLTTYTNNGVSSVTRVWSDPNNPDADEDTLTDLQEFLFGFHPQVANDPNSVTDLVQFDGLNVSETSSPALLLRYEGAAGTQTFVDSSGNENSGTCNLSGGACPTAQQSGRYAYAADFDGSNDALSVDGISLANSSFTLAIWAKFDSLAQSSQTLIGQGLDSANQGLELSLMENMMVCNFYGSNFVVDFTAPDTNWHHWACTYDSQANQLTLYRDGQASNSITTSADYSGTGPLTIGVRYDAQYHFNGRLDDTAVFNQTLSASEVAAVMDGRFNPDDHILPPGTDLSYSATATNTSSVTANGFLTANNTTIDPALPGPTLALGFEPDQHTAYFADSTGEEDSISCVDNGACPTAGVDGKISNAIEFEDANDTVVLPSLDQYLSANTSLNFWIYVESLPSSGGKAMILDTDSTATGALDVYLNSSGNIVFEYANNSAAMLTSAYTFSGSLNQWVHVSLNGASLYINGSKNKTNLYTSAIVGPGRLGNSLDGNSPFHGRLDELVFYDDTLDDGTHGGTSTNRISSVMSGTYTFTGGTPRTIYTLDELISYDGTTFYDSQTDSDPATCGGIACPTLTGSTAGYSGRALTFDGVNDFLTQTGSYVTDSNGEVTLSFYIKISAYPTSNTYIFDTTGGTDVLDMYITSAGKFVATRQEGTHTSTGPIPLNTWTQVSLNYDKYYDGSNWRYVSNISFNGVLDGTHSYHSSSSTSSWDIALTIGPGTIGALNGTGNFLNASLDEMSLSVSTLSFDPPATNNGYENLADAIRSVSCTDVFACPTSTTGKYGSAADFDGDAYLTVSQGKNFFGANQFTEAAWIYSTATDSGFHGIMGYQQGSATVTMAPSLWVYQQTKLHFGFGDGSNWNSNSTGSVLTANAWNYVASTFDGTTFKVYVNGVSVYETSAWAGKSIYPTTKFYIGKVNTYFNGCIDEPVILPVAVDSAGINLLMNSSWPTIDIPTLYTSFSAGALSSLNVSGSAQVSPYAVNSRQRFEQQAEAALQLQTTIDYPVVDDNSASLAVFLPLEETPGSTTFENLMSYYNNTLRVHGTCSDTGCPIAGVRGQVSRGVYFDGLDDAIKMDFSTVPGLWKPQLSTFAMWVKGKQGTLFEICPDYGNCADGLQVDMNRLYTRKDGLTTSLDLARNQWFHLAVTMDSTTNTARVYVNGVQVTSGTHNSTAYTSAGVMGVYLGSNAHAKNIYEGYLDDVRFYSTILSDAQILSLYQNSAPVLSFGFDEDEDASDYTDNSGASYTGQPGSTPCDAVTLTNLTILSQASDARNLLITLDGNQLAYGDLAELASSGINGLKSAFCGSGSLAVSIVKSDNTTLSLGTASFSTSAAGSPGSVTFRGGGTILTLDWQQDAELTYKADPVPGTAGRIGNGALFDGKGSIKVTDNSVPLDFAQDFTLHAWVKTSKTNAGLLVKNDDDSVWEKGEKAWYLDGNGRPYFVGYGNDYIRSSQAINDDYWHFVAVTWDRNSSDSGGTGKMYVDGVDVTAGTPVYAANNSDVSGHTLKIGGSNYNAGEASNLFTGRLDELTAYRRALSSAELDSIYLREARWYRDQAISYLQVDSDTPTITLLSDASYWANGYLQMAVATTDATSKVVLLDVGIKGPTASSFSWSGAIPCQENGISGAAWCPSFDTSTLGGEGKYEIQFRAVDAVGNETISSIDTFYVDSTAPVASSTYNGQWVTISNQDDQKLSWTTILTGSLSDPNLNTSPSVAGSGIDTQTIQVELKDPTGYVIGEGRQPATLNGSAWTVDYKMTGARPQGTYTIYVTSQDAVGNSATTKVGTLNFDERPPKATFNKWEVSSEVIAGTTTLKGVVSDQADWSGKAADFSFEEASGSTLFYDHSSYGLTLSCTSPNCPTLVSSGIFGQALDFDGQDIISVPSNTTDTYAAFDKDALSVSVWVNPDTIPSSGVSRFVTLAGSETAVLRSEAQKLHFYMKINNTLYHIRVPGVLKTGVWQHITGTYDGQTMRLYYNGSLVGSLAVAGSIYTSTLPTSHMFLSSGSEPLDGKLDEVTVYDRALSDAEVYALAQGNAAGVDRVEIGLEPFDFTQSGVSNITWQNATISGGSWSFPIPSGLQGFYNVYLRATDKFGNQTPQDVIWSGQIDTKPPVITGTAQIHGNGSAAYTEYAFTMSDFILDESKLTQPCASSDLTKLTYADTSLPQNGMAYQISGACRVTGAISNTALQACDGAGQCTNLTLSASPVTTEDSILITSPADQASLNDPGTVTITGGAYDHDGIQRIQVKANGVVIDTIYPANNPPDFPWTMNWTPTESGSYLLSAELLDNQNNTITNSISVSVQITPQVQFSSVSYSIGEGGGQAAITVTLSAATAQDVTVGYATSNGTATAGIDYTATSGILTIPSGQTSAALNIPIIQDAIYEGDETVVISLSSPVHANLGSPGQATLTIKNDSKPTAIMPTISFNTSTVNVLESDTQLDLTVKLDSESFYSVIVSYKVSDGTATLGDDYTAQDGVITFAPGDTEVTIHVNILSDKIVEPNETFTLTLSTPDRDMTLGEHPQITVTILDAKSNTWNIYLPNIQRK
jgi:hypothetical protein